MLQKQKLYVESLSEELKESLVWYTQSNYRDFNSYLRGDREPTSDILHHLRNFEKIFNNSPPLETSIDVYRGSIKEILDGKTYISTTLDLKITKDFLSLANRCCLYHINVSPGSRVLPIKNISDIESEDEVILDRKGLYIATSSSIQIYEIDDERHLMKFIDVNYMPSGSIVLQNKEDISEFIKKEDKDMEEKRKELLGNLIRTTHIEIKEMEEIIEESIDVQDLLTFEEYFELVYKRLKEYYPNGYLPKYSKDFVSKMQKKYLEYFFEK